MQHLHLFVIILICITACAPQAPATSVPARIPVTNTPLPVPTSKFVDSTPSASLNLHGKFVFSPADGGIWLQDAATGKSLILVEPVLNAIAQLPAFAPDARRVAYAALVYVRGGTASDIRVVDVDGQNDRDVVQAAGANIYYTHPRWTSDGKALLVTRAENWLTLDERARLELVDLSGTAARRLIIDDAQDGDISADGKMITFVRFRPDAKAYNSIYSLWLANADGSAPTELIAPGIFSVILSPRFSPDGKWIAFSVNGDPQKPLPLAYQDTKATALATAATEPCFLYLLLTCLIETASAHGAPGAVWRVNLDFLKFEQITPIYVDSPTPTWSADGTEIATQDVFGIHLIDLKHQVIYPVDLKHGGSGGLDWK